MNDPTHLHQAFPVASAFAPASRLRPPAAGRGARGFSLAEVLVSLAILMAGIVAIASFFPTVLRHNQRSVDSSVAAYLAQLKAEEIRRDNDTTGVPGISLTDVINARTTPTIPVTFAPDPRFAYSFCGRSLLNPKEPASARVIVWYANAAPTPQNILFELAFQ